MNSRVLVAIALAAVAFATAVHPEEEEWSTETAGDISLFMVMQSYRINADYCSEEVPALKPGFDEFMKSLSGRIRGIGKDLLDSDAFKGMQQLPVPSALLGVLAAKLEETRSELEDLDAGEICPQTLQHYRSMTDEALRDFLRRTLAGIQSTIRTLQKPR